MKTAAEIEKTIRENLEKIEKNTDAKPKQQYLTFSNVIAVALAMLVVWGVLSVLVSILGSGDRGDVAYYQFNAIVLHPLYLVSYLILVADFVCMLWIVDWDKGKTYKVVAVVGVTFASIITTGICTYIPIHNYEQSAAASCFALETGYNEKTVYENGACFKEKKILVAEQIIRATNVEEKTKNIDGQYVEGAEYTHVNGTGETLFIPNKERINSLPRNLDINKIGDGHAYYSAPLSTKYPSAEKSVLTKVSVQKRKTPVENNVPTNDSIIIDGKTYKYSHKIDTSSSWYMVDLYIPEGENLNG